MIGPVEKGGNSRMDCKELREDWINRYFDHTLSKDELTAFRLHIADCSDCAQSFRTYHQYVSYQKSRIQYASSQLSKDRFIRRIKRRKSLPYQIGAIAATFVIGFFGVSAFMDFQNTNNRYRMIIDKSMEMIRTSETTDASRTHLYPNTADISINKDKILKLLHDGE